ncbi:MAG: PilZ domain-containing protein [Methylomonas sp.]
MADEIEEKRRYFRVSDTINLLYRTIDENALVNLSHVSHDVLSNCSLTAALDVLAQESRMLMPRLERRDPELFEYLKLMDTKINLIAQAVTLHDNQFCEHDTRDVCLSATGLAFSNEAPIKTGELLELRMFLTSCMAVIIAYGRVVQCRDNSQDNPQRPFSICVEYINMKEDDRELLIKHVVKKQLQQLRDKNGQ